MGRKVTQDDVNEWMELRERGYSFRDIAEKTGWSEETVRKYVRKEKEGKKKKRAEEESSAGGELAAEAFRLFDKGFKPTKVVQELKIDPEEIEELYKKFQDLEEMYPPRVEELQRKMDLLFPEGHISDSISKAGLNKAIENLQDEVFTEPFFSSFCGSSLTHDWECPECGTKGKVAVHYQCTSCGHDSWWGYHPK